MFNKLVDSIKNLGKTRTEFDPKPLWDAVE